MSKRDEQHQDEEAPEGPETAAQGSDEGPDVEGHRMHVGRGFDPESRARTSDADIAKKRAS
jgi:hypothetical protein